jgi:hypothetical protein
MIVQHDIFDADTPTCFLRLASSPLCQSASPFALVARIPVRHRHKPYTMTQGRVFGPYTACPAVTIVGVRPECDDVQFPLLSSSKRHQ